MIWIIKTDSSTYFRSMHRGQVFGAEYEIDAKQFTDESEARAMRDTIRKMQRPFPQAQVRAVRAA